MSDRLGEGNDVDGTDEAITERRKQMLTDEDRHFVGSCVAEGAELAGTLARLETNVGNLAADLHEVKVDVREVRDRRVVDPDMFLKAQEDIRALRRQVFIWTGGLVVLTSFVVPILLYLVYLHLRA